jgi:UPF0755 protein
MKRLLTFVVLVILLTGVGAYWAWRDLHTPAPLPPGGAVVSVAPGEPFGVTSARLYAAGVVRHPRILRLWARWQGLDRLVRNGEYRFDEALAPVDVLARLRSPAAALHRVTIPEGSTLRQTATLLAAAGFGGADQFRCLAHDPDFLVELDVPASGLEGYLFPDTYAFAWSSTPAEILRAMVNHFRDQAAALRPQRIAARMSEQDMVVLASLIEKETGAAQERALVSAVFHNRLRIGMMLQSDPTAVYGRDGGGVPTAADLTIDTPYNTYRYPGLPPGPICNPGRSALDAALAPAAVPYLYFVARKDGTHEFSTTLEQHNRAVERFQRASGRSSHDGSSP